MASTDIQRFLDEYPSLQYDKGSHRITCSLTKHEMPATVIALDSYVNGRKFKNAFKTDSYNYEQHKPHITPSNKRKHLHELFCTLTLRHIAKTPEAVERHVKGKRFQRALARWKRCQETGERFVPRGGQRPNKATVSENDSSNEGNNFWLDDSDDEVDNDDMSDLYPDEDFEMADRQLESNGGGDSGKRISGKKSKPAHDEQTGAGGSDSDFDMSVLNEAATSEKAGVPQVPVSSQLKDKKKKKRQRNASPVDSSAVKKKKKKHH